MKTSKQCSTNQTLTRNKLISFFSRKERINDLTWLYMPTYFLYTLAMHNEWTNVYPFAFLLAIITMIITGITIVCIFKYGEEPRKKGFIFHCIFVILMSLGLLALVSWQLFL